MEKLKWDTKREMLIMARLLRIIEAVPDEARPRMMAYVNAAASQLTLPKVGQTEARA